MIQVAQLTKSQLERRAKLFTALWLSWIFVGQFVASIVPRTLEVPVMVGAMLPFVLAGRLGIKLWYRAKTTPELPRAVSIRPSPGA